MLKNPVSFKSGVKNSIPTIFNFSQFHKHIKKKKKLRKSHSLYKTCFIFSVFYTDYEVIKQLACMHLQRCEPQWNYKETSLL